MSLSKYMGGIFAIISGFALVFLSLTMFIPMTLVMGTMSFQSALIWASAISFIGIILVITGFYYKSKGKAEVVRGTVSKHDVKIDNQPDNSLVERIVKVLICSNCKQENVENAKFCQNCGNKLV